MPQTGKDNSCRVGDINLAYIRYKIESREYSLSFKKCYKSAIWQTIAQVTDERGEVIPNVVACSKCQKLYKFSSHRMGTSNLLKHKCLQDDSAQRGIETSQGSPTLALSTMVSKRSPATSSGSVVKRRFTKSTEMGRGGLKNLRDQLSRGLLNLLANDILSPNVVEGSGLIDLMQTCAEIGAAKHSLGRIDIREHLPSSSSMQSFLQTTASENRQKLVPEIKQLLSTIGGSLSLELWQDPASKIEYLTITVHTMQRFKPFSRILRTHEFDAEYRPTAENLMTCIYQTLKRYALDDFFHRLVYVTDRNTCISVALNGTTRLACVPSALNALVDYTIQTENTAPTSVILCLLAACSSLALHFRRTELDLKLEERFDRPPEGTEVGATNWIKRLNLLLQIDTQWDRITELLRERDELQFLSVIQRDTLHALLEFMTPFREAIEELERQDIPTLHLVLVWYTRLVKEMQPASTDSLLLGSLKTNARLCLMQMEVHQLHRIALFLHPKLKSLKLLHDDTLKLSVHAEVRSMVSAQVMTCYMEQQIHAITDSRFNNNNNGTPSAVGGTLTGSPRKSGRGGALSDLEDSSDDDSASFDVDEVNKYLQFKVAKMDNGGLFLAENQTSNEFNLLGWWEQHEREFPRLSHVAQFVHSIPASHRCCAVRAQDRWRLHANEVDDVLFMHTAMVAPSVAR